MEDTYVPWKTIGIRLPPDTADKLKDEAANLGVTVSDVLRSYIKDEQIKPLGRPRPVKSIPNRAYTPADPALVRELAKIGNNLNQLARWANTYKSNIEAVQILSQLGAIERDLKKMIPGGES